MKMRIGIHYLALSLFAFISFSGCDLSVQEFPDSEGEVRFLNLSPDAPALSYYLDDQVFADNLTHNQLTDLQPIPTGVHMNGFLLDGDTLVSGSSQFFEHDRHYTIIALDSLDNIKLRTIENYLTDEPDTVSRIRILHAATSVPDIDVYIAHPDSSFASPEFLLEEISFNNNSDSETLSYIKLDIGNYKLRLTEAGSTAGILEQDISLERRNYTIVVIDGEEADLPPRLIFLNDN